MGAAAPGLGGRLGQVRLPLVVVAQVAFETKVDASVARVLGGQAFDLRRSFPLSLVDPFLVHPFPGGVPSGGHA